MFPRSNTAAADFCSSAIVANAPQSPPAGPSTLTEDFRKSRRHKIPGATHRAAQCLSLLRLLLRLLRDSPRSPADFGDFGATHRTTRCHPPGRAVPVLSTHPFHFPPTGATHRTTRYHPPGRAVPVPPATPTATAEGFPAVGSRLRCHPPGRALPVLSTHRCHPLGRAVPVPFATPSATAEGFTMVVSRLRCHPPSRSRCHPPDHPVPSTRSRSACPFCDCPYPVGIDGFSSAS